MVGDLVDDGPTDLVGDLSFGAADGADRLAVDGDAVGQDPCVLRRAAGERDALVEAEQAGRPRVVLDRHRYVAHQTAEFGRQPVQRIGDHLFEPAGLDLDHQPIVHRRARPTASALRRPARGVTGLFLLAVLYTDGVSEASQGGSFFGEAGVAEVAGASAGRPAQAVADAVVAAALAFQHGPARDDIAVAAVKVPSAGRG